MVRGAPRATTRRVFRFRGRRATSAGGASTRRGSASSWRTVRRRRTVALLRAVLVSTPLPACALGAIGCRLGARCATGQRALCGQRGRLRRTGVMGGDPCEEADGVVCRTCTAAVHLNATDTCAEHVEGCLRPVPDGLRLDCVEYTAADCVGHLGAGLVIVGGACINGSAVAECTAASEPVCTACTSGTGGLPDGRCARRTLSGWSSTSASSQPSRCLSPRLA